MSSAISNSRVPMMGGQWGGGGWMGGGWGVDGGWMGGPHVACRL